MFISAKGTKKEEEGKATQGYGGRAARGGRLAIHHFLGYSIYSNLCRS